MTDIELINDIFKRLDDTAKANWNYIINEYCVPEINKSILLVDNNFSSIVKLILSDRKELVKYIAVYKKQPINIGTVKQAISEIIYLAVFTIIFNNWVEKYSLNCKAKYGKRKNYIFTDMSTEIIFIIDRNEIDITFELEDEYNYENDRREIEIKIKTNPNLALNTILDSELILRISDNNASVPCSLPWTKINFKDFNNASLDNLLDRLECYKQKYGY